MRIYKAPNARKVTRYWEQMTRTISESDKVIESVLIIVSGCRSSTEVSLSFADWEACSSIKNISVNCLWVSQNAEAGVHSQRSQTCGNFLHLRMGPNAANLDNLKDDKEQDDRKTIKGVSEQVRESEQAMQGKIRNTVRIQFHRILLKDWNMATIKYFCFN